MNNRVGIRELAMALVNKNKLSLKEAENFVATMFDTLNVGLNDDKQVKLKGLGTFKVMSVSARKSVDVNTGEPIIIDGRDKISFTPDSTMKDLVNKPFAQFDTVVINDGVDLKELERMDWTETASDAELAPLNDSSDGAEATPTSTLPPSKIEAAVNQAADALASAPVEVPNETEVPVKKAPEKSHILTMQQLSALNDDQRPIAVAENAVNATTQLTLTADQLRLLNGGEKQNEHEQNVVQRAELELEETSIETGTGAPDILSDDGTEGAQAQTQSVEGLSEQADETPDATEMDVVNGVEASDVEETHNDVEGEPAKGEDMPDVDNDIVATDTDADNECEPVQAACAVPVVEGQTLVDENSETEDESTPEDTESNSADDSDVETELQTDEEDSDEDGDTDESSYEYEEDEWEEEERRRKRRRLIVACVVGLLVVAGGVAWYLWNQMQLKDNRISHLETLLNTSKPSDSKASEQALSPADSAREDSINKLIDAQTKADLAASEAKIAQNAGKKAEKTDDKKAAATTAENKKPTERAADKPAPKQEKAKANTDESQNYKQYEKDARVRTGAYKIVGIAHVVTVTKGQTLYSLSKSMLGPGMECYIEAVNGNVKELKEGQKIKIPKLELKKPKATSKN